MGVAPPPIAGVEVEVVASVAVDWIFYIITTKQDEGKVSVLSCSSIGHDDQREKKSPDANQSDL